MLRLLTGGESHGPRLTAILDGMPAGLAFDRTFIQAELKRRQGGFGRSARQKIEVDTLQIAGGVRAGFTTGSPLVLEIANSDHKNWLSVMAVEPVREIDEETLKILAARKIKKFRPGHADFAGTVKYRLQDVRDILERASARETAIRVAAGAFAQLLLARLGVTVLSQVTAIGDVKLESIWPDTDTDLISALDVSDLYTLDRTGEIAAIESIEAARKEGDSLGGKVTVQVKNLPPGLGSAAQWDRKLDGLLGQALLSIQSAKAVEIGDGLASATRPGSQVHDAIKRAGTRGGVKRQTNHAGGLEGGMTNGETLIASVYFKPIPTMRRGLPSVSFPEFADDFAHYERSDVCAVPAASVVARAVVSLTVANAFIDKFGADTMQDLVQAVETYRKYVDELTKGKVENAP